jgi:chromosomal replication initiation ATPase DnaA
LKRLDSRFHGNDKKALFQTFYEFVSIETLIKRISKDMGISRESMTGGGRNRKVTRARAALAYAWVRYLGRSGYELAKVLGVSPQAIYAASNNIEDTDVISSEDIQRWCS